MLDNGNKNELIALSVLAGIGQTGFDHISKEPLDNRIELIGSYGKAQAENGDTAGAWETAKIVDALFSQFASNDNSQLLAPGFTVNGSKRDEAFRHIGEGLVAKGDIGHASALAEHMGSDMSFFSLASTIAKAQYKAGDIQGMKKTLDAIRATLANPEKYDPNNFASSLAAETFALCGEINGSKQIIDAIKPPLRHDAVYSRVGQALARNGDIIHAREMIDVGGADSDDLIVIGKAQADKGNLTEARKTFTEALNDTKRDPSRNRYDREAALGRVIGGQIDIGAFSDAIAASMTIEPVNRQWFLIKAIGEEAKRKDDKALHETVTAAMETAKDTSPTGYAVKAYADLAKALGEAGNKDEARAALAKAQDATKQLSSFEQTGAYREIKAAQMAMGDNAGADAADQQLAKANQSANLLQALSGNNAATGAQNTKIIEALKLIQQSKSEDEAHAKITLQRATAVLGDDAQKIEVLIFMSAMLDRNSQPVSTAEGKIERHDFPAALVAIQSTSGMRKDGLLESLVQTEATNGQRKLAFETAKTIADPFQRTITLQSLLPIKSADSQK